MRVEEIKEKDYKTIEASSFEDWMKKRNEYITSTNIIFCLQNFSKNEKIRQLAKQVDHFKQSKESFYKKRHLTGEMMKIYNDLTRTKAKEAGKFFEKQVAKKAYEMIVGDKLIDAVEGEVGRIELVENGKMIWYIKGAGVGATPDYLINYIDDANIELIECKTTTTDFDSEEFNNLIKRYSIQCQCQLLCTGCKLCHLAIAKLNNSRTDIVDFKIVKIFQNEKLQQEILDCVERCLQWLKDVENGVVELEHDGGDDEEILNNLFNQNLNAYLEEYGDAMIFEKEKEKHFEDVKNIIKSIAYNNIKVDGWRIDYKIQNATFETIESLEEKIKKNEKENEELKEKIQKLKDNQDEKILKSKLVIKNIKVERV